VTHNSFGTLYIVSTPIGNLKDITFRAVEILSSVSMIAAEDTRHSNKLLQHYDISTPSISFFEHKRAARIPQIMNY
jgi:Predicted methyltransferases